MVSISALIWARLLELAFSIICTFTLSRAGWVTPISCQCWPTRRLCLKPWTSWQDNCGRHWRNDYLKSYIVTALQGYKVTWLQLLKSATLLLHCNSATMQPCNNSRLHVSRFTLPAFPHGH